MKEVKLRRDNGANCRGIMIKVQTTFHSVTVKAPGNNRANESAKRTIRATQAASSSRVNSTAVIIRAFLPKEINAMSEKVIIVGSRSMHLASSLAVQLVTAAQRSRAISPQTQPAYFSPIGRLSKPTPIKTLNKGSVIKFTRWKRGSFLTWSNSPRSAGGWIGQTRPARFFPPARLLLQ